jgi:hypothetical protein
MQRLATFLQHHEPVQPHEFRWFVVVGIGLAIAAVLLLGFARWADTRHAARVTGSTYASVACTAEAIHV